MPQIRPKPPGVPTVMAVPTISDLVEFLHPANSIPFFSLLANDCDDCNSSNPSFGVHHGTALTACQILAGNQPGFFSTSQNRNDSAHRITQSEDGLLGLLEYYFHLVSPSNHSPYLLCLDFSWWSYPHGSLPPAWVNPAPANDEERVLASHWTTMSTRIKARDSMCCISSWKDGASTAHIVPRDQERWVVFVACRHRISYSFLS